MTVIYKTALVPYKPRQMFDLVDDVLSYPQFLPWCKHTTVIERVENELKASITLAKGGIEQTFSTHNRNIPAEQIKISLLKGPFTHLNGVWQFEPLGDVGSKISLNIQFDFSSRLLRLSLGPVFTYIVTTLVDAFVKRAQQLYGSSLL
jgi:ribosome-associated toxin RatA of RatAB toxin-antitoxin module